MNRKIVMMVVTTIISCFIDIDIFQYQLLPRYKLYKIEHPEYSNYQIVNDVNNNIDLIMTKSWSEYYNQTSLILNPTELDVLVNKQNYLPPSYIPDLYNNMRIECYQALKELLHNCPYEFEIKSSYRSYNYQLTLYNYYKNNDTRDVDSYSLQAGFSEHQTGLALDFAQKQHSITDIENYEGYSWLKENAHKYGFILRYPKDKIAITGIQYEPWHFRYVGISLANVLYTNDWTLEEYHILNKDNG